MRVLFPLLGRFHLTDKKNVIPATMTTTNNTGDLRQRKKQDKKEQISPTLSDGEAIRGKLESKKKEKVCMQFMLVFQVFLRFFY